MKKVSEPVVKVVLLHLLSIVDIPSSRCRRSTSAPAEVPVIGEYEVSGIGGHY